MKKRVSIPILGILIGAICLNSVAFAVDVGGGAATGDKWK